MRSRLFSSFPLLTLAVVAFAACAPSGLRSRQDEVARLKQDIEDIRSIQAEHTSVISTLRTDIRNISGQLEEIQHYTQGLSSLKEDISKIRGRVPPPVGIPVDELEEDERSAPDLGQEAGSFFRDALSQIRLGNFTQALSSLESALGASTDDKVSSPIVFWVAMVHEQSGDSSRALGAYQELITRNPKHKRVSLALYRQGQILEQLGDKKSAKLAYTKIIKEFPRSKEALLARKRL